MKKLIKISALAILAMGLVFNFAACSSGDDDDNNNNTSTEDTGSGTGSGSSESGSSESGSSESTTTSYTLESSAMAAMEKGTKSDGDTSVVSDYFTIYWSASMAVDSSNKVWDDGYTSSQRIKMAGAWTGSKQFIKFTTTKAATVKVWWAAGGDARPIQIAAYTGSTPEEVVAQDGTSSVKNTAYYSELSLTSAGDWCLGSSVNGNYIFKVVVTE